MYLGEKVLEIRSIQGLGGWEQQRWGAGGLDSQPPKIGGWVLAPSSPQPPRKNHMFVGGVFRNPDFRIDVNPLPSSTDV